MSSSNQMHWDQFADEMAATLRPRLPRQSLQVSIEIRRAGYTESRAELLNLSRTGFQIDTGLNIGEGQRLTIYLPGLQSLPARVVWRNDFRVGCTFENPISDYVYDSLLRRLMSS